MSVRQASSLVVAIPLLFGSAASAQNLLPNAHFNSDISGYTATDPSAVSRSNEGADAPGSVQIISDDSIGVALNICIPVTAGQHYDLAVNARLQASGGATGKAGMQAFWRKDLECQEEVSGLQPFPMNTFGGDWQNFSGGATAPATTIAALVQIFAVRLSGSEGSSVTGNIDDVFFGVFGQTTTTISTTTTTTISSTTTTTLATEPGCSDPVMPYGTITTSDALYVLRDSVGTVKCDPCLCDADASGGTSASDALKVLRLAVGFSLPVDCGENC